MGLIKLNTNSDRKRECQDGILNEYMEYASETECHDDFHYWMGINLISACMGRKFSFDMGFGFIYPNLFTLLVGESGFSGKSTAIGMAERVLREAYPDEDPPFLAQKLSPSALIGELSRLFDESGEEVSEGILVADEVSTLFGDTRKDDEILKVLTKLWDCPDTFELTTRMRGRELIQNVCINLWGGSTPSWLKSAIPTDSLEGGFFSRLILVSRPRGEKRIALPFLVMDNINKEKYLNVVNDLSRICTMPASQFKLTNDAARLYTEWYEEKLDAEAEGCTIHMRGYYARKRTTVLKLGMILSLSRDDSFRIEKADIHEALSLLEENETHLRGLVAFLGSSKDGMDLDYLRSTFIQLWKKKKTIKVTKDGTHIKRITHTELLQKVSHRYNLQQIEQMIELLEQAHFLEIFRGRSRLYQNTDDSLT